MRFGARPECYRPFSRVRRVAASPWRAVRAFAQVTAGEPGDRGRPPGSGGAARGVLLPAARVGRPGRATHGAARVWSLSASRRSAGAVGPRDGGGRAGRPGRSAGGRVGRGRGAGRTARAARRRGCAAAAVTATGTAPGAYAAARTDTLTHVSEGTPSVSGRSSAPESDRGRRRISWWTWCARSRRWFARAGYTAGSPRRVRSPPEPRPAGPRGHAGERPAARRARLRGTCFLNEGPTQPCPSHISLTVSSGRWPTCSAASRPSSTSSGSCSRRAGTSSPWSGDRSGTSSSGGSGTTSTSPRTPAPSGCSRSYGRGPTPSGRSASSSAPSASARATGSWRSPPTAASRTTRSPASPR